MHTRRTQATDLIHSLKATISTSPLHRILFIFYIITCIPNRATGDLNWCLNHHTFYQEVKLCPAIRRSQPLYRIETTSKASLRVGDDDFKIDGDLLHFNGTSKLSESRTVAILLVEKKDGQEERVGCMLLKLEVSEKHCGKGRNCTIVISILASLCLILIMGFSISLIILHRRSPLSCDFRKNKAMEDEESNSYETHPEENSNDQGFISPRKASYAPNESTNGNAISASLKQPDSFIVPRKSSLKISRIEVVPVKDDPLKNGGRGVATIPEVQNGRSEKAATDKKSFENEGYQESESSRRNSATTDDSQGLESVHPYPGEGRRKSTVTFSDKTEIIRIMNRS